MSANVNKIIVNTSGNTVLREGSIRSTILAALEKAIDGNHSKRPVVDQVLETVKKSRAKNLKLTAKQVRMALLKLHQCGWIRVVNGNMDAWIEYASWNAQA